ncbi:uncharacterized protein LOC123301011 isoform X2 [Chrysoperla carnea]|uniref:uncharacterized protein LOC123301011 isoform X2 n=1 Tax=Chrysoperla carnea TaxID=189513 RepID=UPI001D06D57B|nr:uncharacterized protein LOC123301011 isoform X2 [Chrysoperla carnea]
METIHSVRIEHGTSTNNGMAYSQRSQPIHRPPQSGGDNGPPPHKQARTALSPPTSRAPPAAGYVPSISPYVPPTHHSPRDTLLGYSIYPTRGDQPSIYARASPAQQPPIEYLQQQQRTSAANMRAPPQQQTQQPPPQQQPPPDQQPHVVRTLPPPSSQDPHRQQEQHGVVSRGGVAQGMQQSPVGVVQSQPPEHLRGGVTATEHLRLQPQQSDHMRDHNVARNVVSEHIRSSVEQQHNVAAVSHRLSQEHVRNSQEVVRIDGITREQLSQSQLRPRISLLSSSTDYITAQNMALRRDMYRQEPVGLMAAPTANIVSVGPAGHVGPVPTTWAGTPAYKKMRLGEQKPDLQPLRIDTREQTGTYNPQVEAISPTPNDHGQDDLVFRSTKDDLLQQISRVDREIAKVESSIHNLKKKQHELEEAASKPAGKQEVEEVLQPKHQSLAQKIYAENRRKAQTAHSLLDNLGSKIDWPLYNQPSDTTVYSDNKRKHQTFKPRLLEYFKKRHTEKEQRETYLTQTYSKLMQEWLKKVDKVESSQKRKAKEAKNREFFEKVFPELRKQREDKERFNRVGARIKSEADLEEIMDGLQEQELEDKKMRSYAVIPPILLDARQRKLCYSNNNGHILDMETEYKERALINVWTNSEKEIFKEKYLQHPKNFGLIASFLDRKSVQDCVQHYYLSKKTENYKQLLRKSRQRTRSSRNNPQKVNNAANNSLGDIALSTGVTTRLQREQQQKIVASTPVTSAPSSTSSSSIMTNSSVPSSSSETTTSVVNTSTASTTTSSTTSSVSTTVTSSTSSSTPAPSCSSILPSTNSLTTVTCNISSNSNSSVTTTSGTTTQPVPVSATTTTSSAVTSEDVNKNKTLTVITTSSSPSLNNSLSGLTTTNSSSIPSSGVTTSSGVTSVTSSLSTLTTSSSASVSVGSSSSISGVQNSSVTTVTSSVTTPVVSNVLLLPSVTSSNSTVLSTNDQQNATNSSSTIPSGTDNNDNQENKISSDNTSNNTSNTTIVEKKKKDRRKDKEHQSVETSDEETPDNPEKGSVPHNCVVCKTELEQYLQSRPLLASHASQYGLHPDQIGPDARVCNTCRCKCVRTRYTHCPLPTCGHHARGRVKRLRTMPSRWMELPQDIWQSAVQEFQIPQGVTKCCSACFNRISRRLAPHLPPSGTAAGSPGAAWGEEERTKLRTLLSEHGAHWSLISERLGRPIHQIKNFYLDQRKRLGLDTLVAEYNRTHHGEERKPVLTDEEESGSSTSSCEEITEINSRERLSSDTTSANSPPETSGINQPDIRPTKPDYDSSATETADEGQAVEVEQRQNYSQATITVVNGPVNPVQVRGAENASPMTVKDLMLNVIEKQLMKNQGGNNPPVSGVNVSGITPTISSILKSETQDITFVREFKSRPTQPNQPTQDNTSLATLSVVNSTHGGAPAHHIAPQQSPVQVVQQQQSSTQQQQPQQIQLPTHVTQVPHVGQIAATITPVPPPGSQHSSQQQPPPQQQEFIRGGEGLVVVQVQQALREREPEPVTLDLSIKRPRDPGQISTPKIQQQHTMYRPQSIEQYYHHQKTPPSVYVSAIPQQHRQKTPTQQQVQNHQQSPKPANPKSGSITLGTPVQQQQQQQQSPQQQTQQQRYDGLLRQMTPPPKMGSITQGTPIHLPGGGTGSAGHHLQQQDKRAYEYYAKRQSPTVQANYQPSSAQRPPQSYSMEQQLSSRQIIMNDYITSQQMHGGASRRNEKSQESPRGTGQGNQVVTSAAAAALYYENQYMQNRTPPPSGSAPPPPPQRQGVIQRHHRPSPPPPQQSQQQQQRRNYAPLAGHEAFSSLVDVAVRQPQLPVPNTTHKDGGSSSGGGGGHEGLGKTIADHTHRYSQLSAMHQQQRRMVELNRQQHLYQQQQQHQQQQQQQHQQQQQQHNQQQQNQHHNQQQSNQHHHQQSNQHHQQSNQHHNQQQHHQQSNQQSAHHQQSNRNEPSTLTAASLIDAIITHQINQCGDSNTIPRGGDANMQQSRPGDRLFQGFHNPSVLENNNGNHHHSPGGGPPPGQPSGGIINVDLDSENSPQQKLTVKDFADSVINRDFNAPRGGSAGGQSYYQHKPPTADERQIIRVAQQKQYHASPPPPPRSTSYIHSQPHSQLSAFDYMKHRIVEVMRTEDDKRDDPKQSEHKSAVGGQASAESPGEMVIDESKHESSSVTPTNFSNQPPPQFAAYSYNTLVGQHNVVNKVDITTSSSNENNRQAEPKPLMSAQYEPLSDED